MRSRALLRPRLGRGARRLGPESLLLTQVHGARQAATSNRLLVPSRRSCDLYAYGRLVFVHGRRLLVRLLMRLGLGARLGSALALGGPEAVKVRREGVVFEDRQLLAVTQGG